MEQNIKNIKSKEFIDILFKMIVDSTKEGREEDKNDGKQECRRVC